MIAKNKVDLTFLKRCRDSLVIPTFASIKHSLRNPRNNHIFNKASQSLLRLEITRTRAYLDTLNKKAYDLHLNLSKQINPELWSRIDGCSTLKALKNEENKCLKLKLKFEKLYNSVNPNHKPLDIADNPPTLPRINSSQVSIFLSSILESVQINTAPRTKTINYILILIQQ